MRPHLTKHDLEHLVPEGNTKKLYPHVWEKICLFSADPVHLKEYLARLMISDRPNRQGFAKEALAELLRISGANEKFCPEKKHDTWKGAEVDRTKGDWAWEFD